MKRVSSILSVCLVALLSLSLWCGWDSYAQKRTSTTVQKERTKAKDQVKQTENQIKENQRRVRQQLNELNSLQSQIAQLEGEVSVLDRHIESLNSQILQTSDSIAEINRTITELKKSASRNLREARTWRQTMSATSMILSSESFRQAVKRAGYLKQLEKSRNKRTLTLKENSEALAYKKSRLDILKAKEEKARRASVSRRAKLEMNQIEGEQLMAALKKQSTTLERELAERQHRAAQLDQELDRIIAEEMRIAQEQERQRQLEEEKRLVAQRAKEEEDRKRLEAERQREQELATATETKTQNQKPKTEKPKTGKLKKEKAKKSNNKELAVAAPATTTAETKAESASTKAESSKIKVPAATFAQSKGKLASPVAGAYNVVGKFGRSQYGNLSKVQVENSGIDIETQKNSQALAVYPGTVSSIFKIDGYNNIVMVRHGEYLTVYANIDKLSVKKGDTVNIGQSLGSIYADPDDNHRTILHFEVRKEREKLNPLEWLKQ